MRIKKGDLLTTKTTPNQEPVGCGKSPEQMGEDAAIAAIKQMGGRVIIKEGHLAEVDLANTQVTDDGLMYLRGLTEVRELDLNNTKVSDAGLVHLNGLAKLKELYLSNTQVTEKGVKELQAALPNCKITASKSKSLITTSQSENLLQGGISLPPIPTSLRLK